MSTVDLANKPPVRNTLTVKKIRTDVVQPKKAAQAKPILNRSERLYMVMLEGGGAPAKFHDTREEARGEAIRLSRKYPGSRLHVLQSWRAFIVSEGETLEMSEGE